MFSNLCQEGFEQVGIALHPVHPVSGRDAVAQTDDPVDPGRLLHRVLAIAHAIGVVTLAPDHPERAPLGGVVPVGDIVSHRFVPSQPQDPAGHLRYTDQHDEDHQGE